MIIFPFYTPRHTFINLTGHSVLVQWVIMFKILFIVLHVGIVNSSTARMVVSYLLQSSLLDFKSSYSLRLHENFIFLATINYFNFCNSIKNLTLCIRSYIFVNIEIDTRP